jgi:hypothetical protein
MSVSLEIILKQRKILPINDIAALHEYVHGNEILSIYGKGRTQTGGRSET